MLPPGYGKRARRFSACGGRIMFIAHTISAVDGRSWCPQRRAPVCGRAGAGVVEIGGSNAFPTALSDYAASV